MWSQKICRKIKKAFGKTRESSIKSELQIKSPHISRATCIDKIENFHLKCYESVEAFVKLKDVVTTAILT